MPFIENLAKQSFQQVLVLNELSKANYWKCASLAKLVERRTVNPVPGLILASSHLKNLVTHMLSTGSSREPS